MDDIRQYSYKKGWGKNENDIRQYSYKKGWGKNENFIRFSQLPRFDSLAAFFLLVLLTKRGNYL